MTSIIAIRTNADGIDGIIMGSDTQSSYIQGETLLEKDPEFLFKIIKGDRWVMGYSGIVNKNLSHFFGHLIPQEDKKDKKERGRAMIEQAINHYNTNRKKISLLTFIRENDTPIDFPLIAQLNGLSKRTEKESDSHEFLLAAYYPDECGLWYIDSYGMLREPDEAHGFKYICLGSGSEKMEKYISEKLESELDTSSIDISVALDIVKKILEKAQEDPLTGPVLLCDYAVLTKHGVASYGEEMINSLIRDNNNQFELIKEKYSKPPYVSIVLAEQPVKEEQKS